MQRVSLFGFAGFLAATALAQSSAPFPDAELIPVFEGREPGVSYFERILREPVTEDLDLVIARAQRPAFIGVFLVSRSNPDDVSTLYLEADELGDSEWRTLRFEPGRVLLWRAPEKGCRVETVTVTYSISAARASLFSVPRLETDEIVEDGRDLRIGVVGVDRPVFLRAADPGFEAIEREFPGARPEPTHRCSSDPSGFDAMVFGPNDLFQADRSESAVVERAAGRPVEHPLPISDFATFATLRPGRVRNGYTEGSTALKETIGPRQTAEGKLWFAKSFYDGEGYSGVGGYGWFDPATRAFHLETTLELADYSASALRVETDAVWLGLVQHGEWGHWTGGLARVDRASGQVRRWKNVGLIRSIARRDDRLYLATSEGPAILNSDGELRRWFLNARHDGKLDVLPLTAESLHR